MKQETQPETQGITEPPTLIPLRKAGETELTWIGQKGCHCRIEGRSAKDGQNWMAFDFPSGHFEPGESALTN